MQQRDEGKKTNIPLLDFGLFDESHNHSRLEQKGIFNFDKKLDELMVEEDERNNTSQSILKTQGMLAKSGEQLITQGG
jgi:hypothetical protein